MLTKPNRFHLLLMVLMVTMATVIIPVIAIQASHVHAHYPVPVPEDCPHPGIEDDYPQWIPWTSSDCPPVLPQQSTDFQGVR